MKRKWKWLILLCIPVVLFVVLLWSAGSRTIPVDVVGELSNEDVAEITAGIKREMRRQIMPDFSWQSFKAAPGVLKRNLAIKLFTISEWTPRFANVYVWLNTNELPRFTRSENSIFLKPGSDAYDKFRALAYTNALNMRFSHHSNRWEVYNGYFTIGTANP
jgi:hypothetical protein